MTIGLLGGSGGWFDFGDWERKWQAEHSRERGRVVDPSVDRLNQPIAAVCPGGGNTVVYVEKRKSEGYDGLERNGKCLAAAVDCAMCGDFAPAEQPVVLALNVRGGDRPTVVSCSKDLISRIEAAKK